MNWKILTIVIDYVGVNIDMLKCRAGATFVKEIQKTHGHFNVQ